MKKAKFGHMGSKAKSQKCPAHQCSQDWGESLLLLHPPHLQVLWVMRSWFPKVNTSYWGTQRLFIQPYATAAPSITQSPGGAGPAGKGKFTLLAREELLLHPRCWETGLAHLLQLPCPLLSLRHTTASEGRVAGSRMDRGRGL